jgi:bifunctional ADP-heptose synthase (sugar kinase/adenylyltransferase)
LKMMASLEWVDYVTYFDELDPRSILELIKPDVHVNGMEYGAECIEKEVVEKHGGKVYLVDRIPGLSTSEVIKKIKQICD